MKNAAEVREYLLRAELEKAQRDLGLLKEPHIMQTIDFLETTFFAKLEENGFLPKGYKTTPCQEGIDATKKLVEMITPIVNEFNDKGLEGNKVLLTIGAHQMAREMQLEKMGINPATSGQGAGRGK